jgi:hypothetical protein
MTDLTLHIIRKMLGILDALGPAGLEEATLKEQADIAAGCPTTTTERDIAMQTCAERGWIKSYRQELTGRIRYYLSDAGRTAKAGL